jgi:hypothetical protein
VDLDPSLPDARPGDRLTEPVTTADVLPDDAWQTVTIEVLTETSDGGALRRDVVLERRMRGATTSSETFPTPDDEGIGFGFGRGQGPWYAGLWLRFVREAPDRPASVTEVPLVDRVPGDAPAAGNVGVDDLLPLPGAAGGPVAMAAIHWCTPFRNGKPPRSHRRRTHEPLGRRHRAHSERENGGDERVRTAE